MQARDQEEEEKVRQDHHVNEEYLQLREVGKVKAKQMVKQTLKQQK